MSPTPFPSIPFGAFVRKGGKAQVGKGGAPTLRKEGPLRHVFDKE